MLENFESFRQWWISATRPSLASGDFTPFDIARVAYIAGRESVTSEMIDAKMQSFRQKFHELIDSQLVTKSLVSEADLDGHVDRQGHVDERGDMSDEELQRAAASRRQ